MGLTQNCFHCRHHDIRQTGYSWKRSHFLFLKEQMVGVGQSRCTTGLIPKQILSRTTRGQGRGAVLSMVLHPSPFTSKYVKSSTPQPVFSRIYRIHTNPPNAPIQTTRAPPKSHGPSLCFFSVLSRKRSGWLTRGGSNAPGVPVC